MRALIRTLALTSILSSTALLGACGGGPKYTIDDALLADASRDEKAGILAAQADLNVADEDIRKAKSDLAVVDKDITLSEAEYKKAKADVDVAQAELDLANGIKDMNRINAAKQKVAEAKLAKEVADAKTSWQDQRRSHAKALVYAAEQRRNTALSRIEQEKAKLVQQKGRKPNEKFELSTYDMQAANAQRKADEARISADREQMNSSQRESKYNDMVNRLQQMRNQNQQTQQMQAPAPMGAPPPSP